MIDLLTPAGERLLEAALAARPVLVLDFDGTIAPLVDRPDQAALHPDALDLIAPLRARLPVAIVSGRGLDDLRARFPLDGVTLVGNHGNEWAPGEAPAGSGDFDEARSRAICAEWARTLAGPLAHFGPGLLFEPKTVSLSIHYRLVRDPAAARQQLLELIGQLSPAPELIEGKLVFNLLAPGLATKFEAIAALVRRHDAGTAIFVGDDVTDERAFERAPPEWLTVRVWDNEVAGGSSARTAVTRVEGVLALLARIGAVVKHR
ncbi:MAG: trehalose-phosphatase [Lautropia sp.]